MYFLLGVRVQGKAKRLERFVFFLKTKLSTINVYDAASIMRLHKMLFVNMCLNKPIQDSIYI